MTTVEIVSVSSLSEGEKKRILGVDPRVNLIDIGDWFEQEFTETWPTYRGTPTANAQRTRSERDAVLADAEVILLGNPYPIDLKARCPKLAWAHQRVAGANNLGRSDLWGGEIAVTTARGDVGTYAIAEYAIAALLNVARNFSQAEIDKRAGSFDRASYQSTSLAGKTLCVLGVGGIGQIVGRLAAGLGMNVVGVRHSVRADEPLPEGFSRMKAAAALYDVLADSDAVVVSCQLTKQTENLMNAKAFKAMRQGGIVVNIARGEIVDEEALLDALDSGHLRGALLDVYAGENSGPPPQRLWGHPKVLITPHNSPRVSGMPQGPGLGIGVFCENLKAYLDGRALTNVIDWKRGY